MNNKRTIRTSSILLPFFGIVIFFLLYLVATFYYPGGNQIDKYATGFSWYQNYWCNLLNEKAINGKPNTAKPFAMVALMVLSLSLIIFWYLFPLQVGFKKQGRQVIQFSGVLSMLVACFIFTPLHDSIINIAGTFGMIALVGTFIGLRKLRWYKLFWIGMYCLLLIVLNNIFYYNKGLIFYLPIIQKITFLIILVWFCLITLRLHKRAQNISIA